MPTCRWYRAAVVVLCIAWLGHAVGRGAAPEARRVERPAARYRGTGSCSAVACHGSPTPAGRVVLQNEHTTWVAQDRHASAYQVLFTERSTAMAKALNLGPAQESTRCLVCHTTRAPASSSSAWEHEGVSCEACHGAADRWIGPHTTAGWRQLTASQKESFGLFATKGLARRAEVCATCHVGAPAQEGEMARDVNHDMIAAGHPALRFEFSAYLALMPAHWVEQGPNAAGDFPARAWAVGQVAASKASLDLLADRAAHGGSVDPAHRRTWPEFAEYSCFSCHRPIDSTPQPHASPSAAPWGTWYHAFPSFIAGEDSLGHPVAIKPELDVLRRNMEASVPDPKEISRHAGRMAEACAVWLAATRDKPLDLASVRRLATVLTHSNPTDWDGQSQRYLASIAVRRAFIGLHADPRGALPDKASLLRQRDELRFPAGFDRPSPAPRPGSTGGQKSAQEAFNALEDRLKPGLPWE